MKKKKYFFLFLFALFSIILILAFFYKKPKNDTKELVYPYKISEHMLTLKVKIDRWGPNSEVGFYGYVLESTDVFKEGTYVHFEFPDDENQIMDIIRKDGSKYRFQYSEDKFVDIAKESKIPENSTIIVDYKIYSTYEMNQIDNSVSCERIKQL